MLDEIISVTPGVIDRVMALLPQTYPQELADSIFNGIRQQCRHLAEK